MRPMYKWLIAMVIYLVIIAFIYKYYFHSAWMVIPFLMSFAFPSMGNMFQWNHDFRNADYKTKRRMAKELNEPEDWWFH